jgi:hypothetical protein
MTTKPASYPATRPLVGAALALGLLAAVAVPDARGQGPYYYPSKGQTQDQQQRDQYECHTWAVSQTGFDPARPPPPGGGAPPPTSSALRGAAGGAAIGAVGGAIGGDAGKGAAIGAATGALVGGIRRRNQQQQQQQAMEQQNAAANAGRDAYFRAQAACMQGRGYAAN